ncbi:hypothetical protein C8J56DRAFT_1050364 [Mycena floridula]|nr:hypothetical protein C8J56DRAFT_1050364 [Mycena floridula]
MSTPPDKVNISLGRFSSLPEFLSSATLSMRDPGYGLGYYVRIILVSQQDSKPIFITSTVLISCFPATYLVFNYIVYGFLMHSLGPRYSIIKPSIIGLVFIMSDVTTFIVQAGGVAMEIDVDHRKLGK